MLTAHSECPIQLYPHQENHVNKIWNLLVREKIFSYVDTSDTGLGKTVTTLFTAWHLQQKYGTRVMIVAPSETSLDNADGWLQHAENWGIEITYATTYTALRGGRGKVSHPWLKPDPEDRKSWTATKEFHRLCRSGLFLVFDEFHHAKNASMTHFACAALVSAAKQHRKVCRVALLSRTPGEKPDVISQLLRMSGVVTHRRMFHHIPFTKNYEWKNYGLGELTDTCHKLAPDLEVKQQVSQEMLYFSARKLNEMSLSLYQAHIRDLITFSMPRPEAEYPVERYNAFLETSPEALQMVNEGIALLSGAVGWDPVRQEVASSAEWKLSDISRGLKRIEQGKLESIARYVNQESAKSPEKKFVICCGGNNVAGHDYLRERISKSSLSGCYYQALRDVGFCKDIVNKILQMSSGLGVNVINGKVHKSDRTEIVKTFQSDTDTNWCLIVSPGTGSESLSFHDKHGGRPREMLVVPDFHYSRVIQSLGRVNRIGLRSAVKMMVVYSKQGSLETQILASMVRKAAISKRLMGENDQVLSPADFPCWIEGDRDEDLEARLAGLRYVQ